MNELGIDVTERPVQPSIWASVQACRSGREFCLYIVGAEHRGREAGLKLCAQLAGRDPETALVLQTIVDEEVAHIALAKTHFGWSPGDPMPAADSTTSAPAPSDPSG